MHVNTEHGMWHIGYRSDDADLEEIRFVIDMLGS